MEQIIGPLDDAGLTQGEERQSELVRVAELANVGNRLVNPGVLLISEIDVGEIVLDETWIRDLWMPQEKPVHFLRAEAYPVVLNQGQADVIIEAEQVVVCNLLTRLLQAVSNRTSAAKGIQAGREIQIGDLLPDPINEFRFATLIAGGGKLGGQVWEKCLLVGCGYLHFCPIQHTHRHFVQCVKLDAHVPRVWR